MVKKSFREDMLIRFQENREVMLAILNKIEEERFIEKSDEKVWSIAEIVEHIIKVEIGVLKNLKRLGANSSEASLKNPPTIIKVLTESSNRNTKVSSPTPFVPENIFQTKVAAIEAFTKHREIIEQFVQTNSLDLISIAFPHPRLGMYNGENWLIFFIGHCQRHIEQILLTQKPT